MKILILNWRDIRNPEWGGAEIFTHEIAKRLAANGHEVIAFASAFAGAAREEIVDGYRVVRRGNKHTVYLHAAIWYLLRRGGKFDLVIDEVNGIPFFTPLYVFGKRMFVVFHVVERIWFLEFPWPVSLFLFHFEKFTLSLYRKTPTVTISESTKKELEAAGIEKIGIVRLGINSRPIQRPAKKQPGLFVFVGRLKRAKRAGHCILAMEIFAKKFPRAMLKIIGTGDEAVVAGLRQMICEKGLEGNVQMLGYVPENEKAGIVASAQAILVPSVREGWGLIVTEANAAGTPAIGYDVNGLRDSIKDGVNGFIVPDGSPKGLAQAMEKAGRQGRRLALLSLESSRAYSWDECAASFEKFIAQNFGGGK